MVKVTLNTEAKQIPEAKPFPKLVIDNEGEIFFMVREWYGLPITDLGDCRWSYDDEKFADFSTNYRARNFTDYNEPITIQNI